MLLEARAEALRFDRENQLSDIWLQAKLARADKLPEYAKFIAQVMPDQSSKAKQPMSEEAEQKWLWAHLRAYGDAVDRISKQEGA